MKDSTLETLAPLLNALRGYTALEEVRPSAFHLKGRDFIHFHEDPDGLYADVLLSGGRIHMPVATPSQQAELLERIEKKIASIESHEGRKRPRSAHRRIR